MPKQIHCPKCRQSFDEGSRRFCPGDGARLTSDDAHGHAEGIFDSLITTNEGSEAMQERSEESPTFTLFEAGPEETEERPEENFFKPKEIGLKATAGAASSGASPFGRKVNPYDIPAGHVDLNDSERTASVFDTFEVENPASFVGRTVKGRYRVGEFLGGDETGLAYIAEDKIADRKVLVRILPEEDYDPVLSSLLAEERVSLSHFTHPHVARLVDSGAFTNGIQYLISEFIDALSVRDILAIHGHFPPDRAARIIRQAAYALSEAHQQGIIHRDLRPENFIITVESGTESLKLVNFGASNGEAIPRTAAYRAPEVLDGRIPTASSDLYGLAVVAFEMLRGELPFRGGSTRELLRSQDRGLARGSSSHAIHSVLDKALSFKPAGRYGQAREFGDAIFAALDSKSVPAVEPLQTQPSTGDILEIDPKPSSRKVEVLKPLDTTKASEQAEPAWKSRSPEPPQEEDSRSRIFAIAALAALLGSLILGWYLIANRQAEPNVAPGSGTDQPASTISSNGDMPPLPRKITQPPNSEYFANSKQNLKGDLIRNFVGFSLYYPKDWKNAGAQEGSANGTRGKFLDIARFTADGRPKEQMLISYYPSKGTYSADAATFAQMVKETNDTLRKILPGYQTISEGEIKVNGDWRAYEVKFQGTGTASNGQQISVWGRRLFIPAARAGVRNGFEVTMIATSLAADVKSVADVGVHGELAPILYSFEPSQNF